MAHKQQFGVADAKFYIVVSEDAGMVTFPSRHGEEGLAVNEARRLAAQHPGVKFLVFALADVVVTSNVTVKSF